MPKLDLNKLKDQVQTVYKTKKRNENRIGMGTDILLPPDFIPAPEPVQRLLGLPGYPVCHLSMISGKPDSGKTSLGMLAMIEAQKKDYYTILIDTEKKFDYNRFAKMGGDPTKLLKILATTIEEGFVGIEEFLAAIYAGDPEGRTFIVWDSIGGTPSKAESEASAEETTQLATAAKVIKRNLRKLVQRFDKNQIGMLMINQMYANIGSVGHSNSGGEGVDYYSTIIIQLMRIKHYTVMKDGEKYKAGIETMATCTKNHLMMGEKTLYKTTFRVKAYEVVELKENKKDDEE